MTTNPRRLVAMIEATDKDYTITNFLPDIKITYNAGLDRFEIEEIRDYINIAYAPNISDVTLIVGQNGTGKTSLLRKVFKGTQDTLMRDYVLLFKEQNNWSVRGEKWNIKLYQNDNKIVTRLHHHPTNTILISSAIEYSSLTNYLHQSLQSHDQTSTGLLNNLMHYPNMILQDTTNQITLLVQQNKNGNSYREQIEHFLHLNGKCMTFNLNNGIIDNDREWLGLIRFNSDDLNKSFLGIESAHEFIDNKINLNFLKNNLGLDDNEIKTILENFSKSNYFDFNQFRSKYSNNLQGYLSNEENRLNRNDVISYKNAIDEIQETIKQAYKRCLITLLAFDKVILGNHVIPEYTFNSSNIMNHRDIPRSIKNLMVETKTVDKKNKHFNLINTFYHYANMKTDELFKELSDLSEQDNWDEWLKCFDAVFNYSGNETEALFYLENDIFQLFLSKIIDNTFINSGNNYKYLNNFINFLTKPIPKISYHTKLLRQLQHYWSFEWDGLSSGELSLLNQLGRLHAAKQSIKSKHVVLLIDELDLGLHPEWQRRWVRHMLPLIGHIFEDHQVQVIMTTHSPIVLSDIYKDNIIFLKKGPQGQPMVVNNAERQETFGQNIHELFADSFFLGDDSGSVRGDYATNLLNLVIDLLYKKLSHPGDCQQETANLLQALNLPDDTNEETLKAYLKKIITSTGEPIIAQKLLEMYQEAFSSLEEKIAELEKEIERLRKGASQDD